MSRVQDGAYTLSQLTLNTQPVFPELYAPLWWYSGSQTVNQNGSTHQYVVKGTTSTSASSSNANTLITLSSSADPNTEYSLEASLEGLNGYTAYLQLYDMTTSSYVTGSQISTSASSFSVIRSGKFTLTPGHKYGVMLWASGGTNGSTVTDISLIIFPPAGSVSPSLSSISLSNPSGGSLKEAYIPLWVMSSGTISTNGTSPTYIPKGSTGASTNTTSQYHLITLSPNWSVSQKFAFEASIYTNGGHAYAELWDMTINSAVTQSQINTTSGTMTLLRSGSFTLTPTHDYGVAIWTTAYNVYLTKAHLVALGG